jgi:hypothetical protein
MLTALRPLGMLVLSCCALAMLHPLPLHQVRFSAPVWRSISQEAKDCLRAMLQPDPQQRPTALQVGPPFPSFLQHFWHSRLYANQQPANNRRYTAVQASAMYEPAKFSIPGRPPSVQLVPAPRKPMHSITQMLNKCGGQCKGMV